MSATLLLLAVMSVEADCRIQTAFGSPAASSVRVPVICNVPAWYTPWSSVVPPSSVAMSVAGVRPAASL